MSENNNGNEASGSIIKVIGVGGAGGNAVDHMVTSGLQGVEFIAANTDAQALSRSRADIKLQLGKTGLGAGAKPEVGRTAAQEQRTELMSLLKGAHMVFITAGMGGGTGTGAAPIVAQVAREMGLLTVAVVTKPFLFEGKRAKYAEEGLTELQKHVDSLIVIRNDRLIEVLGDDAAVEACFKAADDVLRSAVGGITEIISNPGLVNVDFEDVRTIMGEMGMAMMGSAGAAGVDRARIAAEKAAASPLLDDVNLTGARGVLVNITASRSLRMKEVNEVMQTITAYAAEDAHIIFGAVFDESMGDELRVTVVATGLTQQKAVAQRPFTVVQNTPAAPAPMPTAASILKTGTDDIPTLTPNYDELEQPAVFRNARAGTRMQAQVQTSSQAAGRAFSGFEIPAFLRKQAD